MYHSADQPYFYYKEGYYWLDKSKYYTDVDFNDGSLNECYYRSKHIYPKEDGLIFVGYSEPAFKDFMLYPDQNTSEKTIQFTIDESGVSTHTLEGAGFLFNAGIDDNELNGYLVFYNYVNSSVDLYKLSNVDASKFHNEAYYDISPDYQGNIRIKGVELVARKGWGANEENLFTFNAPDTNQNKEENKNLEGSRVKLAVSEGGSYDSTKDIKVQVTSNSLKFYEDGKVIFDTTADDSDIIIEDTGAGGFGPLVSYRSHSCEELSYFTFKDLTMETYRSLSFLDLINQQTWGENTKRFIVNLDGDGVPEFSDNDALRLITSHMNENQVYYIGWGKNNQLEDVASAVYNKDLAEGFIKRIGDRGIFLNMDEPAYDTYQKAIDAIADYIYKQLAAPEVRNHSGRSGSSQPPVITYSDIKEHWARKDIERLATLKLVSGYPDGTFGPDKQITREEVAAMITRMLVRFDVQMSESDLTFTDSDEISWWARGPLGKIAPMEIIKGMPDGTFRPAENTTRAQAVVMILRMLEKAKVF